MTDRMHHRREMEDLARLLDSHGADRTRWPAQERLRFAGFVAESSEARRAVAEAEALDRLLDRAPVVADTRRAGLADRIAAMAAAEPAPVAANVVPLAPRTQRAGLRVASRLATSRWSAAALLAASLIVGVFAGISGRIPPAMQSVAMIAGIGVDVDGDGVPDLGAWDDQTSGAEEDTL